MLIRVRTSYSLTTHLRGVVEYLRGDLRDALRRESVEEDVSTSEDVDLVEVFKAHTPAKYRGLRTCWLRNCLRSSMVYRGCRRRV